MKKRAKAMTMSQSIVMIGNNNKYTVTTIISL